MKFENSPFDCQRVYEALYAFQATLRGKLPASRGYSPIAFGDDEYILGAYLEVSEEAYGESENIRQVVAAYTQTGKWGRPKARTVFWLKECLKTVIDYALMSLKSEMHRGRNLKEPANPNARMGKADQEVLEWFLSERWDEFLLPLWEKNNALHYVHVESWDMNELVEQMEYKLSKKLSRIPDEIFLWSDDPDLIEKRNNYLNNIFRS